MMVESAPETASPLCWLPRPTTPPRNQFGRADGVPLLLKRLAEEHFDGGVTVLSNPHTLILLLIDGQITGATLRSGTNPTTLTGDAALRGWRERTEADAGTRSQLTALDRPIMECLMAALDPQPDETPLASVGQLREALRHLATVTHHGVVDVTAGGNWGRVLFDHGRVLGAYDGSNPAMVASLAGIGPLAAADDALMIVRATPPHPLPALEWRTEPAIVEPARPARPARPTAPAASTPAHAATPTVEPAPSPVDEERDERIESDLLWLLSDVDRDRERASRSSTSDAQLLQVLASFANSMFSMAAQLAGTANPPQPAPQIAETIAGLRDQHPLLQELPLKGDRIDAPALAKRCRSLPADSSARLDLFGDGCRSLLALTRHAANRVTNCLTSQGVGLRCATSLEACIISIELELPSRRLRAAGQSS